MSCIELNSSIAAKAAPITGDTSERWYWPMTRPRYIGLPWSLVPGVPSFMSSGRAKKNANGTRLSAKDEWSLSPPTRVTASFSFAFSPDAATARSTAFLAARKAGGMPHFCI